MSILAFKVVRQNGTSGEMVLAQANTAPNAAGVLGFTTTPAATNATALFTTGAGWVQFDATPTLGSAYLSAVTAGNATNTAPAIKIHLGTVIKINGTKGLISRADGAADFNLTNQSVVISGGGSTLTEDNPNFYYIIAKTRLHALGQTVFGNTVGFWGAGSPSAPTITFKSEDFDATELTGAFRDTGFYGVGDNMFAATTGGFPSTVFSPQGLSTYGLQARYIYGGTENGRTDANALTVYGGSTSTLRGLQFRATNVFNATSGTQSGAYLNYLGAAGGFAPASGTAAFNALDIAYEVNQTGGANGTVTGLKVAGTRTAVVGTHYTAQFGTDTRTTLRVLDGNTEAWVYIGEQTTGFVDAALFLQTNSRQAYFYLDNGSGLLTINSVGIQATALSGTGTQLVQANATGVLSRSTAIYPTATVALTGPAVVWTNSIGELNVDTARFAYDATNFQVKVPNGTAALPGVVPFGDTNTGIYSYAADKLGFSSGGRHTAEFESDATSRFLYLGEGATGITGYAYLGFATNARAGALYMDNTVGNALIPTVPFYAQNGSAGSPQFAFLNGGGGLYRYGADVLGVSAAGRHVARFQSDATSGFEYLSGTSGYAWLGFETSSRAGGIYLDNSVGNALISTVPWFVPNGSAASPSGSLTNSTDTGYYRYAAGKFGISSAGRHTARFESDATSRYLYVGEGGTGITGYAYLGFETNARAGAIYMDNAVGNALVDTVPFYAGLNGSHGSPQWSFVSGTVGLYFKSAGILGISGTPQTDSFGASGFLYNNNGAAWTIGTSAQMTTLLGLTGPAVVWTNGSGILSVDTARFTYDSTNFCVRVPNGSITNPSWTPIGDTNTGAYSYGSDVLGFTTGGRHSVRFTSDATSRYLYIGEGGTGITAYAYLGFETNARTGALYMDNAVGNAIITTVPFYIQNGSVGSPQLALLNSSNTGLYRYAADTLGITTAGRLTARFTSDASTGYQYLTGASGYAYLGFETTSRTAAIYLDNSVGNALISTVPFFVPNGSAGSPSLAFTNSTNTGMFRHSAGRLGLAAAGYQVFRVEASATDRDSWIGEAATGITGLSYLGFETNARAGALYLDNAYGNVMIAQPNLRVTGLAGTGTRLVSADSVGLLQSLTVDSASLAISGSVLYATRTTWALQFGGYFPGIGTLMPSSIGQGQSDYTNAYAIEYDAPFASTLVTCTFVSSSNSLNATVTISLYVDGSSVGTIGTLAASTTGSGGANIGGLSIVYGSKISVHLSGPTGGGIDLRVVIGFVP